MRPEQGFNAGYLLNADSLFLASVGGSNNRLTPPSAGFFIAYHIAKQLSCHHRKQGAQRWLTK